MRDQIDRSRAVRRTALGFCTITLLTGFTACGLFGGTEEPPAEPDPVASKDWYHRSFSERLFGSEPELRPVEVIDPDRAAKLLSRGEYLTHIAGCGSCHGSKPGDDRSNLSGGMVLQDRFGQVSAANLTPDKATGIGTWSVAEVMRAIRASLGKDERPLSLDLHATYRWLSDIDAEAIAVYLRSLPAVTNEVPRREMGRFERKRLGIFARHQDFSGYVPMPQRSIGPTYGRYLATHVAGCYGCHTPQGGVVESAIPFSGNKPAESSILQPLSSLFDLLVPESAESKKQRTDPALRALLSEDAQKEYFGSAAVPAKPETVSPQGADEVAALIDAGALPIGGPDIRGNVETGLLTWSEADLDTYLKSGKTPSGEQIDGRICPWPYFRNMNSDDRTAITKFLKQSGSPEHSDAARH